MVFPTEIPPNPWWHFVKSELTQLIYCKLLPLLHAKTSRSCFIGALGLTGATVIEITEPFRQTSTYSICVALPISWRSLMSGLLLFELFCFLIVWETLPPPPPPPNPYWPRWKPLKRWISAVKSVKTHSTTHAAGYCGVLQLQLDDQNESILEGLRTSWLQKEIHDGGTGDEKVHSAHSCCFVWGL